MKTDYVKKILVIGIIVLFIGSNVVSGFNIQLKNTTIPLITGRANTLYVGGTGEGNYSKIQDAIDNASDGDTVFVYDDSSPYYEVVVVDKSINLIGEDKDTTIINGSNIFEGVISIVVDWVNISVFTIQNSGDEYAPWNGIGIDISSDHNIITDNNIISNNDSGIDLGHSSNNNIITGNNISNNLNGIRIGLASTSGNTITDNKISNNWYGIHLYDSSSNTITGNNISNNKYGICFLNSRSNIITGNTIISNNFDGIILEDSSNNNIITGNNITNNRDGMHFWDSIFNRVLKNNFLGNERDAFFSNAALFALKINHWNQNYWEQPRNLPKPIFGEFYWYLAYPDSEKYHIPWIPQFDWHPAKEPYDIGV